MPTGTILVADDDAAIRTVLNQALARAGYEVRSTGTASALWRWVAAGEGDLVVTELAHTRVLFHIRASMCRGSVGVVHYCNKQEYRRACPYHMPYHNYAGPSSLGPCADPLLRAAQQPQCVMVSKATCHSIDSFYDATKTRQDSSPLPFAQGKREKQQCAVS